MGCVSQNPWNLRLLTFNLCPILRIEHVEPIQLYRADRLTYFGTQKFLGKDHDRSVETQASQQTRSLLFVDQKIWRFHAQLSTLEGQLMTLCGESAPHSGHSTKSYVDMAVISLATFPTHWHLGRHAETLQNMRKCHAKCACCLGLGLGQWHSIQTIKKPQLQLKTLLAISRSSSPETPCLPAEHSRLQWHSTQSPDTENTKLTSTYCKAHILSWGMQMATSIASRKELRC